MKLIRAGFAFYRSIGEEPIVIDLRKRITLVIGANNSGKSNVLAGVGMLKAKKGQLEGLPQTDIHLRDDRYAPRVVADLLVESNDEFYGKVPGDIIRFVREFSPGQSQWIESPLRNLEINEFNRHFSRHSGKRFTTIPDQQTWEKAVSEVSEIIYSQALPMLRTVVFIPQHRQIASATTYSINGAGIIELLAAWQHPPIGNDKDEEKFFKVQDLLQTLLHLPEVRLEVDHDKKGIIVRRDDLRLPLQSYGTGIHQLIIMAVAVLSNDNSIVAIEEPEVNLHPTLQREFLRFLLNSTNNSYLISTHSHALIEPNDQVDVLHVSLVGQTTVPRLVQTPTETLALLRDLGTRASDLLQANAVIWVEGPSDRIYLNRWLSLIAPNLIEGIHYSIMFYGGRLLYHLSLDRETGIQLEDLVRLLRINQHSAIVIDSDRRKKHSRLNETKQRLTREAQNHGVYCWITDGREIENYLNSEAISKAYSKLVGHNVTANLSRFDSLEDVLRAAIGRAWRPKYSYDVAKPARAREIAEHVELNHIGPQLRGRLIELVELIRNASELHHS